MLRAIVLVGMIFMCAAALAEGKKPSAETLAKLEILEMDYRRAKSKGNTRAATGVLKSIVELVPDDGDWRLKLSEELLAAGALEQAEMEFGNVLSVEPDFLEARVGVARALAGQGEDCHAKAALLQAAKRGYSVALMMRKREVRKYFKDYDFVLKLLEADKPKIHIERDPFSNPLRPRPAVKEKKDEKPQKGKLSVEEQRESASEAKRKIEQGWRALLKGETQEALKCYRWIVNAYAKIDKFTDEKPIEELEQAHRIAQQTLYPKIEDILREQTARKAASLLEKLCRAVEKGDRKDARRLNSELLGVVQKALESKDNLLKDRVREIDSERAQMFKTVEILDKFDREVRPNLALRGTITDKSALTRAVAFLDIRRPEGVSRITACASDAVAGFQELCIVRVNENSIEANYRGMKVTITIEGRLTACQQTLP